jgi:hypothetical protein
MTTPDDRTARSQTTADPGRPQYADRVYRSVAGVCGHAPWLALAWLLLAVPLIVAFTLRPAVYASEERIRIRNPFRTITLPWAAVDSLRASLSSELFAGDKKYQLWAIPVSLRARKRAARQDTRAKSAGDDPFGGPVRRPVRPGVPAADGTIRSSSDQAIEDLRELRERHGQDGAAAAGRPEGSVRWAYELIAPAVAGVIALAVLLSLG